MDTLTSLLSNAAFREDFHRLGAVGLDPARHTAADARAHSELVARRARELADLNHCSALDGDLLEGAGLVHDIGKIDGSTSPSASVERLARYGGFDPRLTDLVQYHDVNLPWFLATVRGHGDPPSERAWRKLLGRVDPRLLALFMVADRADCPGGWRANEPLVWFLAELAKRAPTVSALVLDVATEGAR